MNKAFFTLLFFSLGSVTLSAYASPTFDLPAMRTLSLQKTGASPKEISAPALISFFQNDCSHCDQQLRQLDCLAAAGWRVIAIGIGPQRLPLRGQWLMHSKTSEGYWLSFAEAENIGVSFTPLNIVYLPEKKPRWFQGIFACDEQLLVVE